MSEEFFPDIVGYEKQQRDAAKQVFNSRGAQARRKGLGIEDNPAPVGKGKGKKSPLDLYTQQLQKLLGGGYRQPYDDLASKLGTMGTTAQTQINTAMDNLETMLKGQANPFANFQATRTQVSPDLNTLLQSQGVDSTPLQQYATAVNAQQGAQADAFTNMMGSLSGLYDAQQAGRLGDVALNRAQLQSGLAANQAGLGAAVNQQALGQRNELMSLLLQAIAKGGQTRGTVRL
jgi:hypothetical protein